MEVKGELKDAMAEHMTTAQRTAADPKEGRKVFDTDLGLDYTGDGSVWHPITLGTVDQSTLIRTGDTLKQRDSNYTRTSGIASIQTFSSGSWVILSGATAIVTTIGRPVLIKAQKFGTVTGFELWTDNAVSTGSYGVLGIWRAGVGPDALISRVVVPHIPGVGSVSELSISPNTLSFIDDGVLSPGTYTYTLRAQAISCDFKVATNVGLIALEL